MLLCADFQRLWDETAEGGFLWVELLSTRTSPHSQVTCLDWVFTTITNRTGRTAMTHLSSQNIVELKVELVACCLPTGCGKTRLQEVT